MHIHKKIAHCDASFDEENKTAIIGFILYDEEGALLSKKSIGHKGILNSFHAELLGIETALRIFKNQHYYECCLITDVKHIVTKVNEGGKIKGKVEYRAFYNDYVKKLRKMKNEMKCELMWVNRKKNKEADKLTKKN